MTYPACPRPRASRSAKVSPAAEALREPTIATAAFCSASARPRSARIGGAESICLQDRRIIRLAERDEAHPDLARRDELALDVVGRGDADRARRAAAPRKVRQRLERRPRPAAFGDERPKGAGADVLRPDETQPIEALLVGKARVRLFRHRL